MEISSGYLEQWWQTLYQRRWALPGFPFVWRACKLPAPNSSQGCPWEQTLLSPLRSPPPGCLKITQKGLLQKEICRVHLTLNQSTGILPPWNRSEGHQRSVSVTGTPSSASWENSHAIPFLHLLQNTLFRKHWWGFTQNSEAVHQDVPITSSGLRHWPVSSVTANKWVKSWFSSPRGPEVSLRASHLRTSLPPTFQEIWNTSNTRIFF